MENIFAQYQIEMPKAYQEQIRNFVSTGSQNQSRENSPFDRQIDFWFMALCLAFNKGLTPMKEKNTYNAITAEILNRNPHRVAQMQMIALAETEDPNILLDPKRMLDLCVGLANAGIPMLLKILSETEATPLWNIYYELEELA
ncbi:hypothetical protein [Idiomarina sp.]|uniref:hypothetical protein n=1 Tax=Idiomarina sp. TaxID=1874361 RepID=UPI0025C6E02E|nr:hypothetical protein [Idiomarina sp.]